MTEFHLAHFNDGGLAGLRRIQPAGKSRCKPATIPIEGYRRNTRNLEFARYVDEGRHALIRAISDPANEISRPRGQGLQANRSTGAATLPPQGDGIPLQSRIILVADAFEAMTSDRPYRVAPGQEFAVEELQRHAGTQFDPSVVGALCRALEASALTHHGTS